MSAVRGGGARGDGSRSLRLYERKGMLEPEPTACGHAGTVNRIWRRGTGPGRPSRGRLLLVGSAFALDAVLLPVFLPGQLAAVVDQEARHASEFVRLDRQYLND